MSQSEDSRRSLGPSGPLVPPLGLGSWNTWNRMTEAEAVSLVQRAVEAGAGLFDVAYYNAGPHAENSSTDVLFGRALRASGVDRADVVLCGKLWLWEWPSSPFLDQVQQSLERTGLDRFDTVVVGDYFETPDLDRLLEQLGDLVRRRLIGSWGVNNWPIIDLRAVIGAAAAADAPAPTFAQLKYSVVRRSMAEGAAYGSLLEDGSLALQASDVFEGGVLLGNRAPTRRIGADVGAIRDRIVDAADSFAVVAADFGVPPAQLAVAFCLTNPAVANVLFGASKRTQLEESLGAVRLAATRGAEIRQRLAPFWLDGHVNADGSALLG